MYKIYIAQIDTETSSFLALVMMKLSANKLAVFKLTDKPSKYRLRGTYAWNTSSSELFVDTTRLISIPINQLVGRPIGKLTSEDCMGLYKSIKPYFNEKIPEN